MRKRECYRSNLTPTLLSTSWVERLLCSLARIDKLWGNENVVGRISLQRYCQQADSVFIVKFGGGPIICSERQDIAIAIAKVYKEGQFVDAGWKYTYDR